MVARMTVTIRETKTGICITTDTLFFQCAFEDAPEILRTIFGREINKGQTDD